MHTAKKIIIFLQDFIVFFDITEREMKGSVLQVFWLLDFLKHALLEHCLMLSSCNLSSLH